MQVHLQIHPVVLLTIGVTFVFFAAERLRPGRPLPEEPGWLARATALNACQFALTLATFSLWTRWADAGALLHLRELHAPAAEGFIGWFVGSFFFYWWHRLRHASGFWRVFHQIHHSPKRIEILTSFYKHPVEILCDSLFAALILFGLLGVSTNGLIWFNFFAAAGEYFYHANLRAPDWSRHFIQTPQLHSVHHQLDLHTYNFSDLPLWDRIFGTYRDATDFAPACGFPHDNERKIFSMLFFRDVYHDNAERPVGTQ